MPSRVLVPPPLASRPFTTAQAYKHGLSETVLRGRRFRRLLSGVHVVADLPMTLPLWLDAARLVLPPDVAVSGLTGLRLHGVEVGPRWPLRFVSATQCRVRREEVLVARSRAVPLHAGGCLRAEHCWAGACAQLDLVDAVIAGDRLVHLEHASVASLIAVAGGYRGRGARVARRAAALVREGAESPRETYVRLLLTLSGLPEPSCNVNVGTATDFIGRGDLVYSAYRLVVEYDGRHHVDVQQQWEADLDRHDAFDVSGWTVLRVTRRRLRDPRAVARRVHERLASGGYQGPAPAFGREWSDLFVRITAAHRSRIAMEGTWA